VARLIVMRKGGGGKVAVNPDLVSHVRSASAAYTDIFFEGQQVAVEGSFEEVVARLTVPERWPGEPAARRDAQGEARHDPDGGFIFGRVER